MMSSRGTLRYTAQDLRGAIASLAIENLLVTDEDIHEVLMVLNGTMSSEEYLRRMPALYAPSPS